MYLWNPGERTALNLQTISEIAFGCLLSGRTHGPSVGNVESAVEKEQAFESLTYQASIATSKTLDNIAGGPYVEGNKRFPPPGLRTRTNTLSLGCELLIPRIPIANRPVRGGFRTTSVFLLLDATYPRSAVSAGGSVLPLRDTGFQYVCGQFTHLTGPLDDTGHPASLIVLDLKSGVLTANASLSSAAIPHVPRGTRSAAPHPSRRPTPTKTQQPNSVGMGTLAAPL